MKNPTTRKYARSLNEAFGPYCSPYIEDNEMTYWTPLRVLFALTYFAAFVVLSFVVMGWM